MIEKEFVIESIFKTKMLMKSIPALHSYVNDALKGNNNEFRTLLLKDVKSSLNNIEKNNDFNYFDAFCISLLFGSEYDKLKQNILNETFDLNKNFKREDYWRFEDVHYDEGLFFAYTFLNETYKKELNIDIIKIEKLLQQEIKENQYQKIAKKYLLFRKKVIKKSK